MIRTVWLTIACLAVLAALLVGKALKTPVALAAVTPIDETTIGTGLAQDSLTKADRLEFAGGRPEIPAQFALRPTVPLTPPAPASVPAVETRIVSHFAGLGLPAGTVAAAKQSVTAALGVSQHLSAGLAGPARYAARHAFMDGLHAGSFAGAAVTAVAAFAVLAFLPNRDRRSVLQPDHDRQPSTTGPASR